MKDNKKTAFVWFANHFDLIWRRGWERSYEDDGQRWASYADVETVIMDRAFNMANKGQAAYQLEQALSLRMYLRRHPEFLPKLRELQSNGLFELRGGGEAIIDVNMCHFETMARNWASGTRYNIDTLGKRPFLANHCDGFGSSAQFPQVLRDCGFRGVEGLAYSKPDNDFWRGLDGSCIYVHKGWPGKHYFYDHCYHEPCRVCHGYGIETGCEACGNSGFDMEQNFFPPYDPLTEDDFREGLAGYAVTSEEMIPPDYVDALMKTWMEEHPGMEYRWGTQNHLASLLEADLSLADNPPPTRLSSGVENNPAQTGCLVTLSNSKLGARHSEALFYAAEAAIAASVFKEPLSREAVTQWHELFTELPLFHFHDSVTGTHQQVASRELRDRMAAFEEDVRRLSSNIIMGEQTADASPIPEPGKKLQVFSSHVDFVSSNDAIRIELPLNSWKDAQSLIAETGDGRRLPVTFPWHPFSPTAPEMKFPLVHAVSSSARTRRKTGKAFIEARGLAPMAWATMTLRKSDPPQKLATDEFDNGRLRIKLGPQGVAEICDAKTGATICGEGLAAIGSLRLDEDEGDPWGTRKLPAKKESLSEFTKFLGALRFDGYSEAYYYGIYEPNLPFGREKDTMVFGLEWQITVRLLDNSDRVDFDYEVFWKSANRRIRVVFPTQAPTDTGWYSIPGGWLERERYEQTETFLWSPSGDWPALFHFATQGAETGQPGWALVNYGTPSSRIENGQMLVSLLRSPAFGHCLERYGQNYPMPTGNIRDAGWHHFSLSLTPHAGREDMPALCRRAAALNARPLVLAGQETPLPDAEWPELVSAHVTLTVVKPVFPPTPRGVPENAVVMRLLNLSDQSTQATLHQKALCDVMVQECNLIEEPLGEPFEISERRHETLDFGPFKVRSFIVWRKE